MQRGFSMIELLVALMIGAFGVAAAANVATFAFQRAGRGGQGAHLAVEARTISGQLRADLAATGIGSSGAIAIDSGVDTYLSKLGFSGPPTNFALPTIRGADNVNDAAIGGVEVLDGSDVIQLVVPNAATLVRTEDESGIGGSILAVLGLPVFAECPLVYISDSTLPNGSGRAHLLQRLDDDTGGDKYANVQGTLQFEVAAGSQVMCARISTYWVDEGHWLRRTDFRPDSAAVALTGSDLLVPDKITDDELVPGVLDFQVAYAFSSALLPSRTGPVEDRWAFDVADNVVAEDELADGPSMWFEVRQVRTSMLLRTLRKVDDRPFEIEEPALENGAKIPVAAGYSRFRISTSQLLSNLRCYDQNLPAGVAAEPY